MKIVFLKIVFLNLVTDAPLQDLIKKHLCQAPEI